MTLADVILTIFWQLTFYVWEPSENNKEDETTRYNNVSIVYIYGRNS